MDQIRILLQFIDDLLQTTLNWLPNYWSLVPTLLRLKSHEDRFTPVPILSIADMKKDTNLGELLGSVPVVESQMAKLWPIVARGNSESLPYRRRRSFRRVASVSASRTGSAAAASQYLFQSNSFGGVRCPSLTLGRLPTLMPK